MRLDITGIRYFQKIISCFQEDIGPIFKMLEIFHTDLHHFSVPVFSENVKILEFQNFQIYEKIKIILISSYIFEVFCILRVHQLGFPEAQKSRIHEIWRFWSLT